MKKAFYLILLIAFITSCGPEPIVPEFNKEIQSLKDRVENDFKPESFIIEAKADRLGGGTSHSIEIELTDSKIGPTERSEIERESFKIALEVYASLENKKQYSNIYLFWRDFRGITDPNINSNNYFNFSIKQLESGSLKRSVSDFSIGSIDIKMKKYNKKIAGLFWNICINEPNLPDRCYGTISFEINYQDKHTAKYSQELPQFKNGCHDYNMMNFMVLGDALQEFYKLKGSSAKDIKHVTVKVMNCLSDSIPVFEEDIIPIDFK